MIDAEKREKVLKALDCLANNPFLDCDKCPYNAPTLIPLKQRCDYTRICADALATLKEQEVHRDGYWIEDAKTYPGAGLSNYVCSNCGKTGGTWIKHIAPDRTFPWCPFCGSNMSREAVKWDG